MTGKILNLKNLARGTVRDQAQLFSKRKIKMIVKMQKKVILLFKITMRKIIYKIKNQSRLQKYTLLSFLRFAN